ncbi:MAG: hypothetical protein BAJALOKI2v1_240046 [Promethearchaeota archaeon]|nr:MAG: hypothetical protein BAJALOKI2v1_240046 [Candidatus Lokiarchaeota archaeon]
MKFFYFNLSLKASKSSYTPNLSLTDFQALLKICRYIQKIREQNFQK